jgi:hypothetical protein
MGARPETFRSSGAVVFGGITAVGAIVLAILAAVHPRAGAPGWVSAGLVLLALVVYVAQVRPAVVLDESDLVLRNMLESVRVPWPAVKEVQVRQFLVVEVGDREYHCAAVGRSRRQVRRDNRHAVSGLLAEVPDSRNAVIGNAVEESFGRFVETKIRNRASDARARQGIAKNSPEQEALVDDVTRVPAWPEIVVLAATVVTLVITILL